MLHDQKPMLHDQTNRFSTAFLPAEKAAEAAFKPLLYCLDFSEVSHPT